MNRSLLLIKSVLKLTVFYGYLYYIILNSREGFSYDIKDYLYWFEQINKLSFSKILDVTIFPYTFLPYSAGIEVGFVSLIKLVTLFINDTKLIYAIVAIISLGTKHYYFHKLKVNENITYLLLLISFILLEGNALRSALSLSFFMYGLLNYNDNKKLSITFFILSCFMHVQAIFFCLSLILINLLKKYISSKKTYDTAVFIFLTSGLIIQYLVSFILSNKLSFYTLKSSTSTGINLISLTSLLIIIFYVYRNRYLNYKSYYNTILLSILPSLSIFIFVNNISVLGDRLWQWGYLILCSIVFYKSSTISIHKVKLTQFICTLSIFIYLINIIIRYPLTNVFSFLLGYNNLDM